MIITNKYGLPESLVNACKQERHNKPGEISATTLIKGVKHTVLEERHFDEAEADVSDLGYSMEGTALHEFLSKKNPEEITEERFSVKVGDKTVTGQCDLYDMESGTIYDYKRTSVWKYIYKSFDEWRMQGFIYAWLMKKAGLEVKRCVFVPMFRDWSKAESLRNPDYPKAKMATVEFSVTEEDLKKIEEFIFKRVDDISAAEKLDDDQIEPCSPEERWEKPASYAVMKEGRKTAVRVFSDKKDAELLAATDSKMSVVERKGTCGRCEEYCYYAQFCNFYKKLKGE